MDSQPQDLVPEVLSAGSSATSGAGSPAAAAATSAAALTLPALQQLIQQMYAAKDAKRGLEGTFLWITAEVGELAEALRAGTAAERAGEFADVLAWLVTLANLTGIDLQAAIEQKYARGCPGCQQFVCRCQPAGKP
ncbi:MAG: MazG nucleotide pyrophosphohydrolase domain-containing protein [Planctomycetota bacterium]